MVDFAAARVNMVESQLRPNRVSDRRIIEAIENLPREEFFPEDMRGIAYVDRSIKIGETRCILDPMVFARLVQALDAQSGEMALDIACGSGYSAAVLASLCETVVGVECEGALVELANKALNSVGVDNAVIVEADFQGGYVKQAPYNVILINGMVEELPVSITDQLALGGRLAAVIKDEQGIGRATLIQKSASGLSRRVLFDASIPPLAEFSKEVEFSF